MLDKLGEVIHFPNMASLDGFVLNPRCLTYGVYTLLYSEEVNQNKGELSEAEVIKILSAKNVENEHGNVLTYAKTKCSFIINAMEEFKLCYRLPENRKRFVIPDKLPRNNPSLHRKSRSAQRTSSPAFLILHFQKKNPLATPPQDAILNFKSSKNRQ